MALTGVIYWHSAVPEDPIQLLLSIRNFNRHGWKVQLSGDCPPEHLHTASPAPKSRGGHESPMVAQGSQRDCSQGKEVEAAIF